MSINEIKTAEEHQKVMARIEEIFFAKLNTPEGKELDRLLNLVVKYEENEINQQEGETML